MSSYLGIDRDKIVQAQELIVFIFGRKKQVLEQ